LEKKMATEREINVVFLFLGFCFSAAVIGWGTVLYMIVHKDDTCPLPKEKP
jgi:uncharacterized membrane protein YczE